MAVKLRLTRVGKKKQPQYRIVAADARSPRDGRFIEILGHYNPRSEPSVVVIDNDKAVAWLRKGAQPWMPCSASGGLSLMAAMACSASSAAVNAASAAPRSSG